MSRKRKIQLYKNEAFIEETLTGFGYSYGVFPLHGGVAAGPLRHSAFAYEPLPFWKNAALTF